MNPNEPNNDSNIKLDQFLDTGVEIDQSSAEHCSSPARKVRRVAPPPQQDQGTIDFSLSNPGSSSMHAHQVQAHSIQKHINEAVEWFYFFAYQRFNICATEKSEHDTSSEQADSPYCRPQYSAGTCSSKTFLSRKDVIYHMTTELGDGESTSKDDVGKWANALLDSFQFEHLCPSCDGLFKSTEQFESHLLKLNNGQIKCPYNCGRNLVRFGNVLRHISSVHKIGRKRTYPGGEFKCELENCDKTFPTAARLRLHKIRTHNLENTRCTLCRKDFDTKPMLIAHLLSAHGVRYGEENTFHCDVEGCERSFATEKGLEAHKSLTHKQYPSVANGYMRCNEKNCNHRFKTVQGLMRHMEKKHWNKE